MGNVGNFAKCSRFSIICAPPFEDMCTKLTKHVSNQGLIQKIRAGGCNKIRGRFQHFMLLITFLIAHLCPLSGAKWGTVSQVGGHSPFGSAPVICVNQKVAIFLLLKYSVLIYFQVCTYQCIPNMTQNPELSKCEYI